MKIPLRITVSVDVVDWAIEYGIDDEGGGINDDVRRDVRRHLASVLEDWLEQRGLGSVVSS